MYFQTNLYKKMEDFLKNLETTMKESGCFTESEIEKAVKNAKEEKEKEIAEKKKSMEEGKEGSENMDMAKFKSMYEEMKAMYNELKGAKKAPATPEKPENTEKSFSGEDIVKSIEGNFTALNERQANFEKSIKEQIDALANSPSNGFKAAKGSYDFLNKSNQSNLQGGKAVNVNNNKEVLDTLTKAFDRCENEVEKGILGNSIKSLEIDKSLNTEGLNIASKITGVNFELES